ncbi:uncharacterized protein [Aegilops tauschii subsp. strangulata]|nr:uncharacterized protein LOC109740287 [Aegilops tauschii subsp. strangulata]
MAALDRPFEPRQAGWVDSPSRALRRGGGAEGRDRASRLGRLRRERQGDPRSPQAAALRRRLCGQRARLLQVSAGAPRPRRPMALAPSQRNWGTQRTLNPYVTSNSVIAMKYKDGVIMACETGASYGSTPRYKSLRQRLVALPMLLLPLLDQAPPAGANTVQAAQARRHPLHLLLVS